MVDEMADEMDMNCVGENVKVTSGPLQFVGEVQEVNEERKKLKVMVKIFGRESLRIKVYVG